MTYIIDICGVVWSPDKMKPSPVQLRFIFPQDVSINSDYFEVVKASRGYLTNRRSKITYRIFFFLDSVEKQ